jgi:hypothetical protein
MGIAALKTGVAPPPALRPYPCPYPGANTGHRGDYPGIIIITTNDWDNGLIHDRQPNMPIRRETPPILRAAPCILAPLNPCGVSMQAPCHNKSDRGVPNGPTFIRRADVVNRGGKRLKPKSSMCLGGV